MITFTVQIKNSFPQKSSLKISLQNFRVNFLCLLDKYCIKIDSVNLQFFRMIVYHFKLVFLCDARYTFSDILCPVYGIQLTEKHVPTYNDMEVAARILPPPESLSTRNQQSSQYRGRNRNRNYAQMRDNASFIKVCLVVIFIGCLFH